MMDSRKLLRIQMEVLAAVEVGVMLLGKHGNKRETGHVRIQGL